MEVEIIDDHNSSKLHLFRSNAFNEVEYNQAITVEGVPPKPLYDWTLLVSTGYEEVYGNHDLVLELTETLLQTIQRRRSVAFKQAKKDSYEAFGKKWVVSRGWAVCYNNLSDQKEYIADYSGVPTLREIREALSDVDWSEVKEVWVEGGYQPVESLEDWDNYSYPPEMAVHWHVDINQLSCAVVR